MSVYQRVDYLKLNRGCKRESCWSLAHSTILGSKSLPPSTKAGSQNLLKSCVTVGFYKWMGTPKWMLYMLCNGKYWTIDENPKRMI